MKNLTRFDYTKQKVSRKKQQRREKKIRKSKEQIGFINEEKKFWDNPEFLDLKYGTNTHKIGAKGYKTAINKKKGTPFDFFPKKMHGEVEDFLLHLKMVEE